MQKSAMAICALAIAMMTTLLVALPSHAQQASLPPADQEQEQQNNSSDDAAENADEPTQESTEESTEEQADTNLPDIDTQPIQPGSGGPGRFIPSEQISQDLGVSFPVDI